MFAGGDSDGMPGVSLTQAGLIIGTPDYMSPEQAAGRSLDFRSDQFSAGLVFYEMLTRRRLFHRATPVQTLSAIIQDEPLPLEGLSPRVPQPLRWAIERCLAKDPDERFATTSELARDLKQIREKLAEFPQATPAEPRAEQSHARSVPAPVESPASAADHEVAHAGASERRDSDLGRHAGRDGRRDGDDEGAPRPRVRDRPRPRLRLLRRRRVPGPLVPRQADRRAGADLEGQPPRRAHDARDVAAQLARRKDARVPDARRRPIRRSPS